MSNNNDLLDTLRHSTAHIMAAAVVKLFPGTKVAIGPAIEDGFYYDFDLPTTLVPEDLERITQTMHELLGEDRSFEREVVSREEAKKLFAQEPYKLELLEAIPEGEEVSLYRVGDFVDLCRGPHVESTKEIRKDGIKLTSIAGAYWRGKETNPMLTRIYGTVWKNGKDLRLHLKHLEEMEKRDHRKLGKELELFSLHEEAGPGLVYWHPKGAKIRQIIEDTWRDKHNRNGYDIVYTPHIGKSWLWETSGHLDFYKEGMYPAMEMDKSDYYAKPMNCPFHVMIYKTGKHSYRELPFRWAELGTVYRYEKAGALHGLTRVRGFTQDDAHLICTPDQMDEEISRVLKFSLEMLEMFGFKDYDIYISTQPEKCVGAAEHWDAAIAALKKSVESVGLSYKIDEGGGAFYGPKIDIKIKDALRREWQLSTIQFDFNLPERFDMTYVDSDNSEKRPYMIHRALLGSIERFFGILVEHYGGAFPLWLAPEQVRIIPVADSFVPYAKEVQEHLQQQGFRVTLDNSTDRLNAKIRKGEKEKIPCQLILGEKEAESRAVSMRLRGGKQQNGVSLEDFTSWIHTHVAEKRTEETPYE